MQKIQSKTGYFDQTGLNRRPGKKKHTVRQSAYYLLWILVTERILFVSQLRFKTAFLDVLALRRPLTVDPFHIFRALHTRSYG